jgi:hypothetical protein
LRRFVGNTYPVLIEELVEGRSWPSDACTPRPRSGRPDGSHGARPRPGQRVRCGVSRVNGIDLQAIPCREEAR